MEDTGLYFECEHCGADYSLQTDMEDIVPEFCPFCSEPIEILEWKDDENEFGESEG
jgi:hypothetical protein